MERHFVRHQIENWFSEAHPKFRDARTATELEEARVRYLARNAGWRANVLADFAKLDRDSKRELGGYLNQVKDDLEELYERRKQELGEIAARWVAPTDLTMPARHQWHGSKHPVTLVIEEIVDIFRELGFTIALGPQVEDEWYNFGALNFPPDHPAMDAHDTLYLTGDLLLRTHTSPVQMRVLQQFPPPIRVLAPGDVFRRDPFDASHAPMFAQIEGLCIDEGITFVDLKAVLNNFARRFFGPARTRFRPSYFPFTEPSAEMDVECQLCKGVGCAVCKGTGWTEILGSGMVHPNVLIAAGVDAEKNTGWAFGMGPARIALQRYDIPDIRILYDTDVRFLEQIAR